MTGEVCELILPPPPKLVVELLHSMAMAPPSMSTHTAQARTCFTVIVISPTAPAFAPTPQTPLGAD